MTRIDKLDKIYNHFGFDNQLEKLKEEHYELMEAIEDYKKEKTYENYNHLVEEVVDNVIVLDQIRNEIEDIIFDYRLNFKDMQKMDNYKIDRTIERVGTGYYDR